MNKVELVGHVGKDPKIMDTKNGKKVASFSLATNEGYRNAMGEWVNNTTWHRIVLWHEVVTTCENLIVSGSHLYVTGKIVHRSYVDKDGQKRSATEIVGIAVEERQRERNEGMVN